MSIRNYDEQIAALRVENAELRLQCVEWREDWTESQAAIARVRELCEDPDAVYDRSVDIRDILQALGDAP